MKVVADSHAIFWYVIDSPLLTEDAGKALDEAFATDGIVVPAICLLDLWYSTHKKGPTQIKPEHYELVRQLLDDDASNVEVVPFSQGTMSHAESIPREDIADPFDRMIVAAALEHGLSLVTSDKRISDLGVVPIVW